MLSFKDFITEEKLDTAGLQSKIGKTRFAAMLKHPYYKKFAQGTYAEPTTYDFQQDDLKYIISASSNGKTMVQFHMYKQNHKVGSAHLFKHNGSGIDGRKMWIHISSSDSKGDL